MKTNWLRDIGILSSIAMLFACCVLVGYVIGYYLDKLFHTNYLTLLFLFLGIIAGFLELFRLLQKFFKPKVKIKGKNE